MEHNKVDVEFELFPFIIKYAIFVAFYDTLMT